MDGKLFLTAAALLLVAACTKEDSRAAFRSDPDAVRITAQVGDGLSGGFVTTRSNPVSEAPEEQKAFKSGDKVCVTANGQKKVVYTYDGTAWNPEAGKYLKWTSPKMTFSACYPAADGVSATHFTVPADQSDADKIAAADYMTFSAEVTRGSNNGVTLGLTRKMVRIVVEPAIQNQFGGEYYISEIKVHGNRKGYSGGNLVNGDVAVKACQLGGKFYALLPPTTENANAVFIDVTVTKDGVSETLQAKGIPATEAGNSYTVSLKVGKNVASVTEVSVSEWGTSTSIASGEEAVLVPYITFTAEGEQTFKMNFQPQSWYDAFSLKEGDYFEYSVGGGKWTRFTSTISDENA
ncbi:MAG: fimbrillin family protein, partial [Candidatus Cryptobacteroides sp.]